MEQNALLSVIGTTYEEARVYIYLGLWYMPIYIHTTDKDGMVNKYKSLLLVTQPKYRKKLLEDLHINRCKDPMYEHKVGAVYIQPEKFSISQYH